MFVIDFSLSIDKVEYGAFIVIPLALSFLIISELGFIFYLWYLNSCPDHDQRRLLNILYGYLSLVCLGAGLSAVTVIILLTFPSGDQTYVWQINARISVAIISALSITFLLISFAAALSHFKPNLYLEISLRWKNEVAIPVQVLSVIFIENVLRLSCVESDDIGHCEVDKLRVRVTIPITVASCLGQLVVVVDAIWGWKNILTVLRGFCIKWKSSTVAPAPENSQEPANNPTNSETNLFAVSVCHMKYQCMHVDNKSCSGICLRYYRVRHLLLFQPDRAPHHLVYQTP